MKKRNITTRTDAVTKDMVPEQEIERNFNIPSLGVTVKAKSLREAMAKAKEIIKENNK